MGRPKKPKAPPPPPPAPTVEEVQQTGDDTIRQERRRSGYGKTMLTGQLTPSTGKRSTLG